jgi:hypothetical protein
MGFLILKYTFQSYLCAQLAIITFENGQYSEAADQLTASMTAITELFSLHTPLDPRLDIFELVRPYEAVEETSG